MRRLRYGDWVCGIAAVALLVLVSFDRDGGWDDRGWFTTAVTVAAILAGLAVVLLTVTRESPSAPLLALVGAFFAADLAAVALLVEGELVEMAAAVVLAAGAFAGLRDDRSPGAPEIPVQRRAAPPA